MTRTTPELESPSPNYNTQPTEGRLSSRNRFNLHRSPTRLELVTCQPRSDTLTRHAFHKCLGNEQWYFLPLGLEKTCKILYRFWTVAAPFYFRDPTSHRGFLVGYMSGLRTGQSCQFTPLIHGGPHNMTHSIVFLQTCKIVTA
ncbi:hypothetical protein TNCV_3581891 [Trichonephila clavipes]|nr:hypothetical protein TNCV_3581891 [Trichonephila clavipes]